MALDTITEVTSTSWLTRLINSIKSVAIGLLLFLAAFPVLFYNEGCSVRTYTKLKEGAAASIVIPTDKVDPANNNKLVFTAGLATTTQTLTDPVFPVSTTAIKLKRNVQMFQWTETKTTEKTKKVGGGEETKTTYTYEQKWANAPIPSGEFKNPDGHQNPAMPFTSDSWTASTVTLGAFELPPALVADINDSKPLPIPANINTSAIRGITGTIVTTPDTLYIRTANPGTSVEFPTTSPATTTPAPTAIPSKPALGDIKITFASVPPSNVSLVAQQSANTFAPYTPKTQNAGNIFEIRPGILTKDQMFESLQSENTFRTWLVRAAGLAMMFFGLTMIFSPLVVVADFIPLLGNLLGAGLAIFAFLTALALSLTTIAIAWVFYRPVLGITLLIIAAAAIFFLGTRAKKPKTPPVAPATP